MRKMSANGLRWVFRNGGWTPSQEQWETGKRCIQSEEVARIHKFMFQKDSKSSLVGRLMLRKAINEELGIPWADINLCRTDKGKPYLANEVPMFENYNVNVSHHGDYTVLASHPTSKVGVDVMKTEWPRYDKSIEDFFGSMTRQFTEYEWSTINHENDEWDQLAMFNRHWCLKESYVKAVGIGIGLDLKRIEFHVTSDLQHDKYVSDTKLYLDGQPQNNWRFEETKLDQNHCVATALCLPEDHTMDSRSECVKFTFLQYDQLLKNATKLGHMIPSNSWSNFMSRKEKPGKK